MFIGMFLPDSFLNFLAFAWSGANWAYSTLLLLMCVYWLLTIIGAMDLDILDVDMDGIPDNLFGGLLHFLNVGEVPLMMVATAAALGSWVCALVSSFYLHPWLDAWVSLVLVVPNVLGGLLFAKLATAPLKRVFKAMREQDPQVEIVGNCATAIVGMEPGEVGAADIARSGAPIRVNVVLGSRSAPVLKGETILIVDKDDSGLFLAEKYSK